MRIDLRPIAPFAITIAVCASDVGYSACRLASRNRTARGLQHCRNDEHGEEDHFQQGQGKSEQTHNLTSPTLQRWLNVAEIGRGLKAKRGNSAFLVWGYWLDGFGGLGQRVEEMHEVGRCDDLAP